MQKVKCWRYSLTANKAQNVILIVIVFFYLFYPPIFPITIFHVLVICAWIYILINLNSVLKIVKQRYIFTVYALLFATSAYMLFVYLATDRSFRDIVYSPLMWIFEVVPICLSISIFMIKRRFSYQEFVNILCIVCSIQGIFAIISFVNSGFHNWFLQRLITTGLDADRFTALADYRLYGLSVNLTNHAPLVVAFVMVLAFYSIRKSYKYLIYICLMLPAVVLNSRTATILAVLGIIVVLLFTNRKGKIRYLLTILLVVFIAVVVLFYLLNYYGNSSNVSYLSSGFSSILNLLTGNGATGFFAYFTNGDRFVFPKGIGLIFGMGINITSSGFMGLQSDIGYINHIWRGGIIYLVLLIYLFFKLIKPLKRDRIVYICAIMFILVHDFKDTLLTFSNFTNLLFLICIVVYLMDRESQELEMEQKQLKES